MVGVFFRNGLMSIGIEYGAILPGHISSTDTRGFRSHYVVTGHALCLRFTGDKVGEWKESIEMVSQDRFNDPVFSPNGWESFLYWILDD